MGLAIKESVVALMRVVSVVIREKNPDCCELRSEWKYRNGDSEYKLLSPRNCLLTLLSCCLWKD